MERAFDYVVIGSGSSGAVIAARLSEDLEVSVLLLEAGTPNRHPLQDMPLAFARVAMGNIGTFQYFSEPEPGLGGRCVDIPRGKTLGGTSAINAMIAIRGNRHDFDDWRDMGLPGWGYDDVLPYFRKLETHWRGASELHGADGPIAISRIEGPDQLWEEVLASAQAAGITRNEDPNGAEQDGIALMESTVGGGRRSSTARAYLDPVRTRTNLTIETGAMASRIVVERGRAVGLEYLKGGQVRHVRAAREIVLCGGAYNSPQLLMLSGIGPADELREHGVEAVHDLPGVGHNLSDHPNIINEYVLREDVGLTRHLRMDRAAIAAARWFATSTGPFASTGTSANIFLRSREGLDRPDVQIMTLPLSGQARLWIPGLQKAQVPKISLRTGYLQPRSRGWVKLCSADPRDPPRILTNLLTEPEDMEAMVRALRLAREIHVQEPLAGMIEEECLPGPDKQSDEELRAHIRANGTHRSHPVGTCRMGRGEEAVVDGQLRVRGLEGLRVADASIMPTITSGNTNLPCIMIGEKAADMIRSG
jgi:choline dehydrogenase